MFVVFFKRKPKCQSFFDKLVDLIETDHIEVFNGVTYCGERNSSDGADEPIKFNTETWFKIKIGKYVSGRGDWGGGFEYATCAVAEVYIDNYTNILNVCAPRPFYNSPRKEKDEKIYEKVRLEVDQIKQSLLNGSPVRLETRDQWLRGVLDSIFASTYFGEADLWSHPMTISKHG